MHRETFQIELTSDVIPLISARKQQTSQRIKEIVFIELFREGKISSGKAAQILNMKRLDFIALLSRIGVPYFHQDKEELSKELSQA